MARSGARGGVTDGAEKQAARGRVGGRARVLNSPAEPWGFAGGFRAGSKVITWWVRRVGPRQGEGVALVGR